MTASTRPAFDRQDVATAACFALAAGIAAWVAAGMLLPAIGHDSTFDYWFESDGPAIVNQLTDRFTPDNERTNRHPLFALLLYPLVAVPRALGASTDAALALAIAGVAAMWAAAFFVVVRSIGLKRIDAAVFTVLALVVSASMFWLPAPETFAPASATLLVALAAAAWHERLSWTACVLATALSLSMTVTNGVAGFLLCLVVLGLRRGATAIAASLVLVAGGQAVERLFFPHAEAFFLPGGEIDTSAYVFNQFAGGPLNRLAGFFLHSIVLPPLQQGYTGYLSVQQAVMRGVGAPVLFAWILWLLLLVAGSAGLAIRGAWRAGIVLMAVLAAQFALAMIFGQETFLYALQSAPFLVVLAACGCFTRWRPWVLAGACSLIAVAAFENGGRFVEAADRLNARHEAARAFVETLHRVTPSADLVVLGLPPSEVYGWQSAPVRMRPGRLSMLPQFDAAQTVLQGWHLHAEHWSPETLEQLRAAGARIFASRYRYGLEERKALQDYLEVHGRALERTNDWVVYKLEPAAAVAAPAR